MRAVKLILALLCLVGGAGLAVVGIAGIQTFGSEGRLYLESPVLESGRDSYALVIDVADVETGLPWSDSLGETTVGARSGNQDSLFAGLAPTPDLDEYLRGISYDVVRNEGAGWQLSPVPGTKKPDPPGAERFWTRRGAGAEPTIPFKQAPGGKTTFVVMGAEGESGIVASMTVGYRSSVVYPLSLGAIGLGAVLILLAVFLVFRSRRKPQRPLRHEQPPSGPIVPIGVVVPSDKGTSGEGDTGHGPPVAEPVGSASDTDENVASLPSETDADTATGSANVDDAERSGLGHAGEEPTETITNNEPEDIDIEDTGKVDGAEGSDAGEIANQAGESEDGHQEDRATGDPNATPETSGNARVDPSSTDVGGYESWFRDGETK